nr:hypothetical protein BaRGS_034821 [Batillaria attramentaria]
MKKAVRMATAANVPSNTPVNTPPPPPDEDSPFSVTAVTNDGTLESYVMSQGARQAVTKRGKLPVKLGLFAQGLDTRVVMTARGRWVVPEVGGIGVVVLVVVLVVVVVRFVLGFLTIVVGFDVVVVVLKLLSVSMLGVTGRAVILACNWRATYSCDTGV